MTPIPATRADAALDRNLSTTSWSAQRDPDLLPAIDLILILAGPFVAGLDTRGYYDHRLVTLC